MSIGTAICDDMVTLLHGDCREAMATLDAESVDAIVTDPPYELGFMGKRWDASGIAYDSEVWAQAFRVLKPGGHLLAFGGTRTWHRLAVAIEDAGFEVRDSIAWMYGSGFPKSLDVSKAIDKNNGEVGRLWKFTAYMRTTGLTAKQLNEATGTFMGSHYLTDKSQPAIPTPELWRVIRPLCGDVPQWVDDLVARIAAEREVVIEDIRHRSSTAWETKSGMLAAGVQDFSVTAPSTPAAQQWKGWGTALKPAFEPIVVARKPLIGTVAENVLAHGTGALNIDGCRIGYASDADKEQALAGDAFKRKDTSDKGWSRPWMEDAERVERMNREAKERAQGGRWPANVILDESQAAELDRQSGDRPTSKVGQVIRRKNPSEYESKSIGAESRPAGAVMVAYGDTGGASRFFYVPKANSSERPRAGEVAHPTVKPLDLMRYLVKLVTPPGGTVLEPFAGSGTTLEACLIEGFNVIGIELTEDYLPLIKQRLSKPIEQVLL